MSITDQHIKEILSRTYIAAIVARAGFILGPPAQPEYGIDGMLHGVKYKNGKRCQTPDAVALQIKSTVDYSFRGEQVIYEMEIDAYNKIARDPEDPDEAPTILLLFCMPRNPIKWLSSGENGLFMRHCCYWYCESDFCSNHHRSMTISIPRSNMFNASAVSHIYTEYRKYKQP